MPGPIVNPESVHVGDQLRSKPVGSKDWFIGEVVEVGPDRVILRDAERRRYVRDWDEVETVK
jgi:hypothetical protein